MQKAAKISKKLEFNGDRKISDNLKNEIQGLINEIKDNLETITFDDVRRGLLTAQAEDFEETIGGAK